MTYGEAHVAEQMSVVMINGEWVQTVQIPNKPKPMNREDAARYYNTKLFAYWMDQLDDELSISEKAEIVSQSMFGHANRYKLFQDAR